MGPHKGRAAKERRQIRKRKRKAKRKRDAEVTKKYGIQAHRACGRKIRYKDELTALARAERSMLYGAPTLKVYRCPYCGGWHLTSKVD